MRVALNKALQALLCTRDAPCVSGVYETGRLSLSATLCPAVHPACSLRLRDPVVIMVYTSEDDKEVVIRRPATPRIFFRNPTDTNVSSSYEDEEPVVCRPAKRRGRPSQPTATMAPISDEDDGTVVAAVLRPGAERVDANSALGAPRRQWTRLRRTQAECQAHGESKAVDAASTDREGVRGEVRVSTRAVRRAAVAAAAAANGVEPSSAAGVTGAASCPETQSGLPGVRAGSLSLRG